MEDDLNELIVWQQGKLFDIAKKIVPHITYDDLLQPFDFPELEHNPLFRYEEGVWAGLLEAKTIYLRWKREREQVLL